MKVFKLFVFFLVASLLFLEVSFAYTLKVVAKVDVIGKPLSNVAINVDKTGKVTNSKGEATFDVKEGNHSIYVYLLANRWFSHVWDKDCNGKGYWLDSFEGWHYLHPYHFSVSNDKEIIVFYRANVKIEELNYDGKAITGRLIDEEGNPLIKKGSFHFSCSKPEDSNSITVDRKVLLYATRDRMITRSVSWKELYPNEKWEKIGEVKADENGYFYFPSNLSTDVKSIAAVYVSNNPYYSNATTIIPNCHYFREVSFWCSGSLPNNKVQVGDKCEVKIDFYPLDIFNTCYKDAKSFSVVIYGNEEGIEKIPSKTDNECDIGPNGDMDLSAFLLPASYQPLGPINYLYNSTEIQEIPEVCLGKSVKIYKIEFYVDGKLHHSFKTDKEIKFSKYPGRDSEPSLEISYPPYVIIGDEIKVEAIGNDDHILKYIKIRIYEDDRLFDEKVCEINNKSGKCEWKYIPSKETKFRIEGIVEDDQGQKTQEPKYALYLVLVCPPPYMEDSVCVEYTRERFECKRIEHSPVCLRDNPTLFKDVCCEKGWKIGIYGNVVKCYKTIDCEKIEYKPIKCSENTAARWVIKDKKCVINFTIIEECSKEVSRCMGDEACNLTCPQTIGQDTPICCKGICMCGGIENSSYPLTCNDGIDNDCDGYTDSSDPGCIGKEKSITVSLPEGWSLISAPLKNFEVNTDCSYYPSLWYWNPSDKKWIKINSLKEMEPGKSYWIYSYSPCSIVFKGEEIEIQDFPYLEKGFNMVGSLSKEVNFFELKNCNILAIYEYSDNTWYKYIPSEGKWYRYSPYLKEYVEFKEKENKLIPGRGYWFKVEDRCKLSLEEFGEEPPQIPE